MFKLIGFLMITVSGTFSGYSISKQLSERVKFMEEYMEFISSVETDIRYICTPISEIVKKYSALGEDQFYLFLRQCTEYISNGISFPKSWTKCLEIYKGKIKLSEDEYRIINNFGIGLGTSDIDGQIAHCTYHKQTVKPYIEAERENKKSKSKMYCIIGMCVGTILGLIII